MDTIYFNRMIFISVFSEIREFVPNSTKKARDVVKDMEVDEYIEWNKLLYFESGYRLNKKTASDACYKFEYYIMSDTTITIVGDD